MARSLLEQPDVPIAEAPAAAGLSRSTFAHVKGALLARGLLAEDVWVDVAALGFPFVLVVGLYRRPRRRHAGVTDLARILSQGTAPIAHLVSPTHEVAVTPYPDLTSARNVVRGFEARAREIGLLAPPFIAVLSLPQSLLIAHSQPGDLTSAWLKPRA